MNWKAYEQCASELGSTKQSLSRLMQRKASISSRIEGLLQYDYKSDFKINETQQLEEKYKAAMNELDEKEKRVKNQLNKHKYELDKL